MVLANGGPPWVRTTCTLKPSARSASAQSAAGRQYRGDRPWPRTSVTAWSTRRLSSKRQPAAASPTRANSRPPAPKAARMRRSTSSCASGGK